MPSLHSRFCWSDFPAPRRSRIIRLISMEMPKPSAARPRRRWLKSSPRSAAPTGFRSPRRNRQPAANSVATVTFEAPADADSSSSQSTDLALDDLCNAVFSSALDNDLPVPFFANLIWQESRLRDDAVSKKGALGIAQFMPQTAAETGLDDPFDPLQAIPASARFLRELRLEFGNLGFVAAAYNAGAHRVAEWLEHRGEPAARNPRLRCPGYRAFGRRLAQNGGERRSPHLRAAPALPQSSGVCQRGRGANRASPIAAGQARTNQAGAGQHRQGGPPRRRQNPGKARTPHASMAAAGTSGMTPRTIAATAAAKPRATSARGGTSTPASDNDRAIPQSTAAADPRRMPSVTMRCSKSG